MKDFPARLEFLLAGRKKHPWGQALAISQGVITTMFDGTAPHPDVLSVISRVENVSLSWLLDARGAPFVVVTPADSDEAAGYLDTKIKSEAWSCCIFTDDNEYVVVMARPDTITARSGQVINFISTEIIGGACCNEDVITFLFGVDGLVTLSQLKMSTPDLHRLKSGWMGNYELVGWRDHPGIMSDLPQITTLEELSIADNSGTYNAQDVVTDADLMKNISELTPKHKIVTSALIKALLQSEGKEWKYG